MEMRIASSDRLLEVALNRRSRRRYLTLAIGCALCVSLAPVSHAQQRTVTLTPALVEPGSPELIRVEAAAATNVTGEWLGRRIQFFPAADHRAWYALAGVDVEAPEGESILKVSIYLPGIHGKSQVQEVSDPVAIHPAHYRTGTITVPPQFVEPDAESLKEIEQDRKIKSKVFAAAETEKPGNLAKPLWSGNFEAPVKAQATDSFGTRRTYNGKLASIHKGTDFRAASGTPVNAGNAGTVVLAQHLYYEGNCVMIDHGFGLMSISMHLSKIDVKPGQHVARGQLIGLSGATGRVTGPHLHWAIRWQGAMLDPAKLLKLNLSNLR